MVEPTCLSQASLGRDIAYESDDEYAMEIREDFLEVVRCLQHHALFESLVVIRIQLGIGRKHAHTMQLQPLPREGIGESFGFRLGNYSRQLRA